MSHNTSILLALTVLLTGERIDAQHANGTFHTAVAKAPDAGTIFIYPERIPLKDGGFFNAERGMIFVPLNRAKASSPVIGIEVYRFKAAATADPATPPVFYLHGGPSFGGLERQLGTPGQFELRWQPYLAIADVVVISQRGIGPSKPTTLIETTTKASPPDQPYDDAKAIAAYQKILEAEKTNWEQLGLDLSGFTVVEAAADINDVRKALGYDKITIWGGSFGSHWGMAYLRNYPETVARAVMRGMEGPDHTYDHPGHYWNVFKRVAADAEQSPDLQGKIPDGGLIKAMETVVARIDQRPVTVRIDESWANRSQDVLIDGSAIRRLARGYTGGLMGWPADVIRLYNGDYQTAARTLLTRSRDDSRSYRTASYWMLDCGSGITPERLREFEADPALGIVGSTYWGYAAGCSVWNSDLGDGFRQNFEVTVPTVIVHGTWDTSTPYENATELVPYFKNSKFVTVIRGPHGAIRAARAASPAFETALMRFAATGDMSGLPDQVELPLGEWVVPEVH